MVSCPLIQAIKNRQPLYYYIREEVCREYAKVVAEIMVNRITYRDIFIGRIFNRFKHAPW